MLIRLVLYKSILNMADIENKLHNVFAMLINFAIKI